MRLEASGNTANEIEKSGKSERFDSRLTIQAAVFEERTRDRGNWETYRRCKLRFDMGRERDGESKTSK
jgi:hypothetical protein